MRRGNPLIYSAAAHSLQRAAGAATLAVCAAHCKGASLSDAAGTLGCLEVIDERAGLIDRGDGTQRESSVAQKAANVDSIDHSPPQINFIFIVLFKSNLDRGR
jgi:hypothetical protein